MSIRDQGLQHWTGQTDKVKQLYNQLLVRHGVMLVGPTGGGKTTARSILQRALVLLPTIHSANDDDFTASAINAASQRRQSVFIVSLPTLCLFPRLLQIQVFSSHLKLWIAVVRNQFPISNDHFKFQFNSSELFYCSLKIKKDLF